MSRTVIYIQLHPDVEMTQADVKEFAAKGLARYKIPKYIQFVDAYPMTVTGKEKDSQV